MAISIGEIVGTITLNDKFSAGASAVNKSISGMGASFGAITAAVGGAATLIAGTTAAIVALGVHGSDVADVSEAFAGLSQRSGETADVMLGKLQEGTLGTISNFDLMTLANKTLSGGMVTSADDMGTLASAAKMMSDRLGGSTSESFESLSKALTKGTTKAAELKFMFQGSDTAIATYAAGIGKLPKDLTDTEKASALTQLGLSNLRKELTDNGPATKDFADNIAAGKVAVQNFVDSLGVAIARSPVIAAAMDSIARSLNAAFGGSQQATVQKLAGFVNDFAIGVTFLAGMTVTAADWIVRAWYAAQVPVLIFKTSLLGTVEVAATAVAKMAELATSLPGVGSKFDGVAQSAETLRASIDKLGESSATELVTASKGALGHSEAGEALGKMKGAVELALEKMISLRDAQIDLTSTSPAPAIRDIGEAVGITSEQLKALDEGFMKGVRAAEELAISGAARMQELQDEITLANKTGLEARLFEVEIAREKELAGLTPYFATNKATYDALTAMVKEKYRLMGESARSDFFLEALTAGIDYKSMTEQQFAELVERVKAYYAEMGVSADKAIKQITLAHTTAGQKERDQNKLSEMSAMNKYLAISGYASSALRSIFGKSKTAAIAAAIIDTAAAVVSSFKNAGGFPWGLIPAAAMAAAGYAQIQQIRSQDAGFATGTPGTAFQDFGAESTIRVHGREAIVNEQQGRTLADMLAGDRDRTAAEVRSLADAIREERAAARRDMAMMPTMIRDALMLAGA